MVSRRNVIIGGATGFLTALGGCLGSFANAFDSDEPNPKVTKVKAGPIGDSLEEITSKSNFYAWVKNNGEAGAVKVIIKQYSGSNANGDMLKKGSKEIIMEPEEKRKVTIKMMRHGSARSIKGTAKAI